MRVAHLIKQKPYEKIKYVLHRHPITFIPKIALFLVLSVIPLAVYGMIDNLFPTLFQKNAVYAIAVLTGSAYYLSILLFFYMQFIVFYLDMWVVTNDRIIDVEQLGLFSRTISELDLFRIQDVTTDVHGIFPTFFKYGTVTIKTASNNIHIVFHDVKKPNTLREELIQLSHEDRKYHYGPVLQTEN